MFLSLSPIVLFHSPFNRTEAVNLRSNQIVHESVLSNDGSTRAAQARTIMTDVRTICAWFAFASNKSHGLNLQYESQDQKGVPTGGLIAVVAVSVRLVHTCQR